MLPNQFTFTEWVHSSSLSLNTVTTEITIIRLVGAVYGKKKETKSIEHRLFITSNQD